MAEPGDRAAKRFFPSGVTGRTNDVKTSSQERVWDIAFFRR